MSNCPNPLFEKWLEEWKKEEAEKNSDLQFCYAKALKSLRRYPLKISNGQECLVLNHFGTRLAAKLDRKLAEYRLTDPDVAATGDASSSLAGSSYTQMDCSISDSILKKKRKRKKKTEPQATQLQAALNGANNVKKKLSSNRKEYCPNVRSGPYAILITMLREMENNASYPGFMLKAEIMDKAQDLCDASFTRADPRNRFYTAWNGMTKTLGEKELVVTRPGRPTKYILTDKGIELARKLKQNVIIQKRSPDSNSNAQFSFPVKRNVPSPFCKSPVKDISMNSNPSFDQQECFYQEDDDICVIDNILVPESIPSTSDFLPEAAVDNQNSNSHALAFEQIIFMPGDYKIVLLVDYMETIDKTKFPVASETIRELTNLKVNFERRRLNVGDFMWIARNNDNKELVLPYIVERKRMDDLGGSIKDGRFHEQKFRLRRCGLQNIIYLIEKFGNESINETRLGLPVNTLHQAIVNTQVVDQFLIKTTNSHQQSTFYLSVLTNLLTDMFKDKTLISCPRNDLPSFDFNAEIVPLLTFQEFNNFAMKNKNMRIQDMFMKHLLQLKGLSVEKASTIIHKYPTPRLLAKAFEESSKPEILLANLTYGVQKRNIGPTISKSIYQLYTDRTLS